MSDVQQGLRSNMNYGIVSEMQKRRQWCVGFSKDDYRSQRLISS